jgi:WD40 repeat protein
MGWLPLWILQRDEVGGFSFPHGHLHLEFSRDGQFLAALAAGETGEDKRQGQLLLWSVQSRAPVKPAQEAGLLPTALRFSPDNRLLAVADSYDLTVTLWDTALKRSATLTGFHSGIDTLAFSPDFRRLAACTRARALAVWNLTTGRSAEVRAGSVASARTVTFSLDGRRIATLGDGGVRLYDSERLQEVAVCKTDQPSRGSEICFLDPDTFVTTVEDELRLWRAPSFQQIAVLRQLKETDARH